MSLSTAQKQLGWPSPQQILDPKGAGPRVFARLAEAKIGQSIRRLPGGTGARIGVLTGNPESDSTEAPIGIVCEFVSNVPPDTLRETHRLAWNFCRCPLLLTLEANIVRAWTCCEPPSISPVDTSLDQVVDQHDLSLQEDTTASDQAAQSLHWVQLITGRFFRKHSGRFEREHRADETLLANLDYVREELKRHGLESDTAHDLLARIIFIQFLFDRKDSAGVPALNGRMLGQLQKDGTLSKVYTNLSEILLNYDDSYHLFQWLNSKFNGDLFPGKGATRQQQQTEWRAEMAQVKSAHLELLSDFVAGTMQMSKGQYSLWQFYSFDAIPLEFISSIYEMFVGVDAKEQNAEEKGVKKKDSKRMGVHYTRSHLVDAILDGLLPWDDTNWNVRVLDPACGSGIFLVKAFQRIIYRWRLANPGEEPKAAILKQLLENNLVGIDIDPHAVRVASFSLYLAMCDEIDPRHYWKQVKFPRLRGTRLINADFFQEDVRGIRSLQQEAEKYDLVVGNAPWGKDTLTEPARKWARNYGWPVTNKESGTLFLPKAAILTKETGRIRMIVPAGALLFNSIGTAVRFRRKLLETYKVEEIINLSALRFVLFPGAVSPACIITLAPCRPDGAPIQYISPKSQQNTEDGYRILVEPNDVHWIDHSEALGGSFIWSALMWGGRRDWVLLQKLSEQPNLESLKKQHIAHIRRGVSRGDRKTIQKKIVGMRIIEAKKGKEALDSAFLTLSAKQLPKNEDSRTHSRDSTDMSAFQLPQMILKQSWSQKSGRFKAVLVESDATTGAIFCDRSFTSVHVDKERKRLLEAACLTYNSHVPVYYLLLTSGRFASYRPEPNKMDLLRVPLPVPSAGLLDGLDAVRDVDARVEEAFGLKDAERVLIDDLCNVTLMDFKGNANSLGRQSTHRGRAASRPIERQESVLTEYCEYFLRVLRSGFDNEIVPRATIFHEGSDVPLPLRLVAIHFDEGTAEPIQYERIQSAELLERLKSLNEVFLNQSGDGSGGIFYQRVVTVFSSVHAQNRIIPTIYFVKPDQIRHWTRSIALRDADEVGTSMWLSKAQLHDNAGSR